MNRLARNIEGALTGSLPDSRQRRGEVNFGGAMLASHISDVKPREMVSARLYNVITPDMPVSVTGL